MRMDLPYAVALRDLFGEYKMRAQQNTRYMESDGREATVSHVHEPHDLAAHQRRHPVARSRPTRAATCPGTTTTSPPSTRPSRRWWAWTACARWSSSTARPRSSRPKVREIKERAVLFLEAMLARRRLLRRRRGGLLRRLRRVPRDPRRRHRAASADGGVAAGTIVERAADYLAPVCHHFGENHLPEGYGEAATRGRASPATSSAAARCATPRRCRSSTSSTPRTTSTCAWRRRAELREKGLIKPEVEWAGRRLGRGHACSCRPPSASPSSRRSSSARR